MPATALPTEPQLLPCVSLSICVLLKSCLKLSNISREDQSMHAFVSSIWFVLKSYCLSIALGKFKSTDYLNHGQYQASYSFMGNDCSLVVRLTSDDSSSNPTRVPIYCLKYCLKNKNKWQMMLKS